MSNSSSPDVYSRFETELEVRPDDIDLYQHVHSTRYLDYVLAARFSQMKRYYGMSMEDFGQRGLGWYMTASTVNYKRPLGLGDRMVVRCWVEHFTVRGCRVAFEIDRLPTRKRSCDGFCDYALIDLQSNRAVALPDDIKAKYSI